MPVAPHDAPPPSARLDEEQDGLRKRDSVDCGVLFNEISRRAFEFDRQSHDGSSVFLPVFDRLRDVRLDGLSLIGETRRRGPERIADGRAGYA